MNRRTLNDPEAMAAVPFPLRLKNYVTYGDYDLYDDLSSKWNTFSLLDLNTNEKALVTL